MFVVSQEEMEYLFNGFVLMIRQPEVFREERMLAEIWLSDYRNEKVLKPYTVEAVLELEVLPEAVYQLLKEYHDDYVEQMPEHVLEQYRDRQLPKNILLGYN